MGSTTLASHALLSLKFAKTEECTESPQKPVQADSIGKQTVMQTPSVTYHPTEFYPISGNLPDTLSSNDPLLDAPKADAKASRGIPVFRPTMEQFEDFYSYLQAIDHWGQTYGLVKVIPPASWVASLPDVRPMLPDVKIRKPIEQYIQGANGFYKQTNIVKGRDYSLRAWADFAKPGSGFDAPNLSQQTFSGRNTRGAHQIRRPPIVSKKRVQTQIYQDEPSSQNALRQADDVNDAFYSTFDPKTSWLPEGMQASDYSPEACREIETAYWSSFNADQATSRYGADSQGTLFTPDVKSWNVAALPSYLTELLANAGHTTVLPGVTDPYLYFGLYKATFSYHTEDLELYSINYVHFGAPKFWYSIPPAYAARFEKLMAEQFSADAKKCPEFLRHKSFMVSPRTLAAHGIPVNVCVQHQTEFMITFPRGYHAGFNLGLNCAESVNFALPRWIDLARTANKCRCIDDAVTINVDALLMKAEDRRQKGLKPGERDPDEIAVPAYPIMKKAKANGNENDVKKTFSRCMPCVLCPSETDEDLLPIAGTSYRAHRICGAYIPETYLDEEVICGFQNIPKSRFNLKCALCVEKDLAHRGAKFQCTFGKCTTAMHVSCAVEDPWIYLDLQSAQDLGLQGDAPVLTLLCKAHNPEYRKHRESERRLEIHRYCEASIGAMIKVRSNGSIYHAKLLSLDSDGRKVIVQYEHNADDPYTVDLMSVVYEKQAFKLETLAPAGNSATVALQPIKSFTNLSIPQYKGSPGGATAKRSNSWRTEDHIRQWETFTPEKTTTVV